MEKLVLKVLAFDLAVPTVLSFLDRYEKGIDLARPFSQKLSNLTRVSFIIDCICHVHSLLVDEC